MKFTNERHLTYCTNIHAGERWEETFESIKKHAPSIKKRVSPQQPFGLGLRLSNTASNEILKGDKLIGFKSWLNENGFYVFTLNGFPYGNFHHTVVKDRVHYPDWASQDRVIYTKQLFRILSELLPEGMDGGVSTSPVSYSPWFNQQHEKLESTYEQAAFNFAEIVKDLVLLKKDKGKTMHLDIEPEPDGLIESAEGMIEFFNKWLLPKGTEYLCAKTGISFKEAREAIREHVNVCYDVCHFAVGYEKPGTVFKMFEEEGIKIGKIQISSALKLILHSNIEQRQNISQQLKPFAESTYLHQVVEKNDNDMLLHYTDLDIALKHIEKDGAREWRIHYHVPVFMKQYNQLLSTQEDILAVLEILQTKQVTNHLEVETYTWEVLPKEEQLTLSDSISGELEWVIMNGEPAVNTGVGIKVTA